MCSALLLVFLTCQHAPTRSCISCTAAHTHPCTYAPTHACPHAPVHTCNHAPMHSCIFARCMVCARSRYHRRACSYVLACHFLRLRARPCCCSFAHRGASSYVLACHFGRLRACANTCARVPMCVLGPMFRHACSSFPAQMCWQISSANVLAAHFQRRCAGTPRSQKRSRRLPHAHECRVAAHITSDMPRASQPETLTARSTG